MGIAGKVAETGISMNIPDVYQCELFNPKIDRKTGFLTKNMLCCAIADMSGDFVAVVQVGLKYGMALTTTRVDNAMLVVMGQVGLKYGTKYYEEEDAVRDYMFSWFDRVRSYGSSYCEGETMLFAETFVLGMGFG